MNDNINLIANNSTSSPFHARIVLTGFMKDTDGRILLSPECATRRELNHCIDDLIRQLERLKNTS